MDQSPSVVTDYTDDPADFDAYLENTNISEPMRGVYRHQLRGLLIWCADRGVMPARLDTDGLAELARAYATESRYSLGAALEYWRSWGAADVGQVHQKQTLTWSFVQVESADVRIEGDEYAETDPATVSLDAIEIEAMDVAETAVSSYERYLVSVGLSVKTIDTYLRCIRKAAARLADMGGDLDTADAYQLASVSALTPLTHSMRGQLRSALAHYYDYLDRRDAPLRAVRVPPQPKMVNKALEPDETVRLLKIARERWPEGGVVLLGLYLGLRRAEIACAEWERFDDKMEWYTVLGKGDKTATVPVHPVLADLLAPRRGSGYMFPGRPGVRAHIAPATVQAWTLALADDAGVGKVTPHQLRHTALTAALDGTQDLRSVMMWARHERPQTTVGYTRTTKDQLRRVSDALDWMDT